MSNVTDEQRAKFEAWAESQHYNLDRDKYGGYASIASHAAWAAWQAALAAQEGGDGERVAVSEDKLLFIAMNAYDNTMARGLNEVAAMRMAVRNVLRAAQEGTGNDR